MLVIPAIDMKDGKAVRLKQGRMEEATVYADSVVAAAERWVAQGAARLHLVDLDGAFAGKPVHSAAIAAVAAKFPQVPLQAGGGIRSLDALKSCFDAGVAYGILGTAAVKNPALLEEACRLYPGRVILGLDARDGRVAVEGWGEVSNLPAEQVLERFSGLPLEAVVYTDIARDGMLSGLHLEGVARVRDLGFRVIASGGLSSLEDLDALEALGGVYGVIAGKALYEGRFTLTQALARAARGRRDA